MGVQGNRLSEGFSTQGLLNFDFSDFHKIKDWSGLTMESLKEAVRMATEDTGVWANKEAAKDLGRELGVPYPAARKRVKVKRRMVTWGGSLANARIWYGINPLDAKYLKPKQLPGGVQTKGAGIIMRGFISAKMKGHVFKRRGPGRLPIDKQSLDVEHKTVAFLQGTFEPKVAAYYMDRFYFYIDRLMGNTEGTAAAALGSSVQARTLFERKT